MQFLWASEEINKSPDEYWTLVMDVARRSTLARVRRCSQIMGREESDDLSAAQVFYPCMQCADIFYLKVPPLTLPDPTLSASSLPLHAVRRHLLPQGASPNPTRPYPVSIISTPACSAQTSFTSRRLP